jgi:hypothetical protein
MHLWKCERLFRVLSFDTHAFSADCVKIGESRSVRLSANRHMLPKLALSEIFYTCFYPRNALCIWYLIAVFSSVKLRVYLSRAVYNVFSVFRAEYFLSDRFQSRLLYLRGRYFKPQPTTYLENYVSVL